MPIASGSADRLVYGGADPQQILAGRVGGSWLAQLQPAVQIDDSSALHR
jgi:hypothetical protein